jgi:hypothetical protein
VDEIDAAEMTGAIGAKIMRDIARLGTSGYDDTPSPRKRGCDRQAEGQGPTYIDYDYEPRYRGDSTPNKTAWEDPENIERVDAVEEGVEMNETIVSAPKSVGHAYT